MRRIIRCAAYGLTRGGFEGGRDIGKRRMTDRTENVEMTVSCLLESSIDLVCKEGAGTSASRSAFPKRSRRMLLGLRLLNE